MTYFVVGRILYLEGVYCSKLAVPAKFPTSSTDAAAAPSRLSRPQRIARKSAQKTLMQIAVMVCFLRFVMCNPAKSAANSLMPRDLGRLAEKLTRDLRLRVACMSS